MARYILRRMLSVIPVLLLVTFLAFSLIHLVPGDPAVAMLGDNATNEELYQQMRAELGLDRPFLVQYGVWLGHLAQGQFGITTTGHPVSELIAEAIGPTLLLTAMSMLVSITVGISLGMLAGSNLGTRLDTFVSSFAIVGFSVPGFVIGLLLLYGFTVAWPILPGAGYVPFFEDPWLSIQSLILPSLGLGFAMSAVVMRQMRSSMAMTLNQDYIMVAQAKGIPRHTIMTRHALKNSIIPVLTIIGMQTGRIFGSAVVIETIFSIPGMGHLAVDSIFTRNYTVLQSVILVSSCVVMLANLTVDLLYAAVDPRIRYE